MPGEQDKAPASTAGQDQPGRPEPFPVPRFSGPTVWPRALFKLLAAGLCRWAPGARPGPRSLRTSPPAARAAHPRAGPGLLGPRRAHPAQAIAGQFTRCGDLRLQAVFGVRSKPERPRGLFVLASGPVGGALELALRAESSDGRWPVDPGLWVFSEETFLSCYECHYVLHDTDGKHL